MKTNLTALVLICFVTFNFYAQDWKVYPYTPEGSMLSFPVDEGRHTAEDVEWWYTNGQLKGETTGKTYTYMLSYFYYSYSGFDGFRIFNITDQSTGVFYEDTKAVNYVTMATDGLNIGANVFLGGAESWTTATDDENNKIPFEYNIKALSSKGSVNLNYKSLKRPLILGGTGKLDQGANKYTYYYSLTDVEISGSITLNGVTENVSGIAWIDRQYGNFNPINSENYEWFSLQLSNNMDINLWNIFTAEKTIPESDKYRILSVYVDEDTQYTISDFEIERLAFNCMPDEQKCYAKQWRLTSESKNIDLTITTRNDLTEVTLPFRFFEGATTISGTVNGVEVSGNGFAELIKSYEHPVISFNMPENNIYAIDTPISWTLENPDEGRPTLYNVYYSTDGVNFSELATNLSEMTYLWDNPSLAEEGTVWFKIIAHTQDYELIGEVISEALNYDSLSVSESLLTSIQLFPNPVSNKLTLKYPASISALRLQIIDVSGRIVLIQELTQNNSTNAVINTQQLKSGFYYVIVESGLLKKSFKVVKD